MPEQLVADTLPRTLGEDRGQTRTDSTSRLEKDILVDAEELEPLLLAAAPRSPRTRPRNSDLAYPLVDQGDRLEELRHCSLPRQVEEGGPQGEQYQTAAEDTMIVARDSDSEPKRGEGRENYHYQDSSLQSSSSCSHDTNDKGNLNKEDNSKEPRPAKQRKQDS
jgi:hypothetical protein